MCFILFGNPKKFCESISQNSLQIRNFEELNPRKNYDFIFDTYQNRDGDEINQNLSNEPSSKYSKQENKSISIPSI